MPQPVKKMPKTDMCFREAQIELVRMGEGENAVDTVRLSVSSETPYYRAWMWDNRVKDYIKGYEVLGHAEGEIDFPRTKRHL